MLDRDQYEHTEEYWLELTNNPLHIHYTIM